MKGNMTKRAAAVLISAAVALQLCGCHERILTDDRDRDELSFSWWGGDDRNKRTLDGLSIFTDEAGITVRPHYAEFDGFKSKMDTQIYSGTEADVMQLNYDWLYQYTSQGEEFYDLSQLEEIDLSTYPEGSLDCGIVDGKLQAIPYGMNALTFIYNKTLLDSYGIEPPSTWGELFDAAAVMRRDGVYILAINEKLFWMIGCAYLEQTTGHKAFSESGELLLTEEDLAVMLEFCGRIIEEKVSPPGADFDRREFSMLRMAGTVTWSSSPSYYEKAAEEMKMEFALGPYITAEDYISFGWYEKPAGLYAIKKDTKNPDDAGLLLNYLINSADMAVCLGMSKGVPLSTAAEEALEARGLLAGAEYEANRMMLAESRMGTMSPVMENVELIAVFNDALESVYYGSAATEQAAAAAYEALRQVEL